MWNWKRICFLTVSILALAVYYLYSDFQSKTKREEQVESKKLMVLPEGAEILALTLDNKGKETLELVKEGNQWWLKRPRRYQAEDFIAEGLRTALTATTWERSFPLREVDLEQMGLKSPSQKISVALDIPQKEREIRNLFIGHEAPTGRYIYAMWENGQQVFMLRDQFARSFDKSRYSVRKKRIFSIPAEEIYAVDVALEGKNLTLIKLEEKWHLVSGKESDIADQALAQTFISNLTALYVKEFLDDLNPNNPDLDLSSRKHSITLTDHAGNSYVLWIGSENKEKESFYALKDGEDMVLMLSSEKIKDIPSVFDLLRKRLAEFGINFDKILEIEMKEPNQTVHFTKTGGEWQLGSGQSSSGEELKEKIGDLTQYLKDVSFKKSVSGSKQTLGPEVFRIRFVSPDKSAVECVFHKQKDGKKVDVRISSQQDLYQIDSKVSDTLERYFREVSDYKKV